MNVDSLIHHLCGDDFDVDCDGCCYDYDGGYGCGGMKIEEEVIGIAGQILDEANQMGTLLN